jgi:hypothetical protein
MIHFSTEPILYVYEVDVTREAERGHSWVRSGLFPFGSPLLELNFVAPTFRREMLLFDTTAVSVSNAGQEISY